MAEPLPAIADISDLETLLAYLQMRPGEEVHAPTLRAVISKLCHTAVVIVQVVLGTLLAVQAL